MDRLEFSSQLATYLIQQSDNKLAGNIFQFLTENNIYITRNEYVCGWSVIDVLGLAEQLEIKLTKDEAYSILADIENHFDASIGVNWNTLEYYIKEYINKNE